VSFVCQLFVCLSVMHVLWLSGTSYGSAMVPLNRGGRAVTSSYKLFLYNFYSNDVYIFNGLVAVLNAKLLPAAITCALMYCVIF